MSSCHGHTPVRSRRRGLLGRVTVVSALLASGVVAGTPAVEAAQAQWSSASFGWSVSTGPEQVTTLRQTMRVDELGASTYAALLWSFADGSTGYVGIQTDPTTPDGSPPPSVGFNFALWDATQATGRHCGSFGGEGVGQRCTRAVNLVPGTRYTFEITYVGDTEVFGSWRASVSYRDASGSTRRVVLGTIVSSSSSIDMFTLGNFIEYFGEMPASCGAIPVSVVSYRPPVGVLDDQSTSMFFDRDHGIIRGPDPCSATGGARVMVAEMPGGSLLARMGGTRTRSAGLEIRTADGLCLTSWNSTAGSPVVALQCVGNRLDRRWYLSAPPSDLSGGAQIGAISNGSLCLDWTNAWLLEPITMQPCEEVDGIPVEFQRWATAEDGTIRPAHPETTLCLTNRRGNFLRWTESCDGSARQTWTLAVPSGDGARTILPSIGEPPGMTADLGVTKDSRGAVLHRWRVATVSADAVQNWATARLEALGWSRYGSFFRKGGVLVDTKVASAGSGYPGEYRLSLIWVN